MVQVDQLHIEVVGETQPQTLNQEWKRVGVGNLCQTSDLPVYGLV